MRTEILTEEEQARYDRSCEMLQQDWCNQVTRFYIDNPKPLALGIHLGVSAISWWLEPEQSPNLRAGNAHGYGMFDVPVVARNTGISYRFVKYYADRLMADGFIDYWVTDWTDQIGHRRHTYQYTVLYGETF